MRNFGKIPYRLGELTGKGVEKKPQLLKNQSVEIIAVIGTGSLAVGLSYFLKEKGYSPRLMGREGPIEFVGIKLKNGDKTINLHFPQASSQELKAAKIAFVAVKAYQLKLALVQHLPKLSPGTVVIPVGNGAIDKELQEVQSQFPQLTIRLGVTTLAVSDDDKGRHILRNEEPHVVWGKISETDSEPNKEERDLIARAKEIFSWSDTIAVTFRKKWLFNTVLNSICGIFSLAENGEALRHPKALMRAFAEAYALAEEHWGPWPEDQDAETLFAELLELIEKTFENENSMMRDRRLERPTETSYLAGVARGYEDFPFLQELDDKLSGRVPIVGEQPTAEDFEAADLEADEPEEEENDDDNQTRH